MLRGKSILVIYLLVAVAFTNISNFTMGIIGLPVLPVLFALATLMLFFKVLKANSYLVPGYMSSDIFIINFFFLLLLSFGLINADLAKALKDEVYLLLAAFFLFQLIIFHVQKQEEIEGVLFTTLLCAPLITLQGGYQFYVDLSTGALWEETRASGWWIDPNDFAIVLNMIYIISFYFIGKQKAYLRWAGYLAQISAAAGIFLSLSRGGMILFLLITLMNWRVFLRRKLYLAAVVMIVLSLYTAVSCQIIRSETFADINVGRLLLSSEKNMDDYSNGRSYAATSGLLIYSKQPLTGAGFGNILKESYEVSSYKIHAHNMFIEILALSGPFPLAGYLFMLWYLYQGVSKKSRGEKDLSPALRQFIIVLAGAGVFSHYLLFMKPVWIMLALFPLYNHLSEVDS